MSQRVLLILLVVSMLFNVAVLIGFAKARREAELARVEPPPDRLPPPSGDQSMLARLQSELKLDEAQSAAVKQLFAQQQAQRVVFTESLQVVREDLQQELRRTEPDLERLRTLVDQEADLSRQRRQAEAETYGELLRILTPEQKQTLGNRLNPNAGRSRGPATAELIKRFDRDGDGRLDADEGKQARKDLEGRRREVAPRVPSRPPIWPWFDADGDGELDATERAEMDAFVATRRPPANPGGLDGRPDRRDRSGPDGRGQRAPQRQPQGDARSQPAAPSTSAADSSQR